MEDRGSYHTPNTHPIHATPARSMRWYTATPSPLGVCVEGVWRRLGKGKALNTVRAMPCPQRWPWGVAASPLSSPTSTPIKWYTTCTAITLPFPYHNCLDGVVAFLQSAAPAVKHPNLTHTTLYTYYTYGPP